MQAAPPRPATAAATAAPLPTAAGSAPTAARSRASRPLPAARTSPTRPARSWAVSSGRWPDTRFPTRPAAARAARTSPPRPARSAARSRATRSRTGSREAPPTASPCAWRTATCAPCSRPTWRASARVLTYASAVAAHRCAERRPIMEKARLMAGLFFVDLLPAAGGEIAAGLQPTLQRLYRIGLQALLALHDEIGRAHVWTPVTNAQLVCRLLLEKKKLHQ